MYAKYFVVGSLLVEQGQQVTDRGVVLFEEGFWAELVMMPFVLAIYFLPAGVLGGLAAGVVLQLRRLLPGHATDPIDRDDDVD